MRRTPLTTIRRAANVYLRYDTEHFQTAETTTNAIRCRFGMSVISTREKRLNILTRDTTRDAILTCVQKLGRWKDLQKRKVLSPE